MGLEHVNILFNFPTLPIKSPSIISFPQKILFLLIFLFIITMPSRVVVRVLLVILSIFLLYVANIAASSSLPERLLRSTAELRNHTAVSEFRLLNRRQLIECPNANPYLKVSITSNHSLSDDEYVTVNITGVFVPSTRDWVAMISPSQSEYVRTSIISFLIFLFFSNDELNTAHV